MVAPACAIANTSSDRPRQEYATRQIGAGFSRRGHATELFNGFVNLPGFHQ
jgi:hypothetical protein